MGKDGCRAAVHSCYRMIIAHGELLDRNRLVFYYDTIIVSLVFYEVYMINRKGIFSFLLITFWPHLSDRRGYDPIRLPGYAGSGCVGQYISAAAMWIPALATFIINSSPSEFLFILHERPRKKLLTTFVEKRRPTSYVGES